LLELFDIPHPTRTAVETGLFITKTALSSGQRTPAEPIQPNGVVARANRAMFRAGDNATVASHRDLLRAPRMGFEGICIVEIDSRIQGTRRVDTTWSTRFRPMLCWMVELRP